MGALRPVPDRAARGGVADEHRAALAAVDQPAGDLARRGEARVLGRDRRMHVQGHVEANRMRPVEKAARVLEVDRRPLPPVPVARRLVVGVDDQYVERHPVGPEAGRRADGSPPRCSPRSARTSCRRPCAGAAARARSGCENRRAHGRSRSRRRTGTRRDRPPDGRAARRTSARPRSRAPTRCRRGCTSRRATSARRGAAPGRSGCRGCGTSRRGCRRSAGADRGRGRAAGPSAAPRSAPPSGAGKLGRVPPKPLIFNRRLEASKGPPPIR